MTATHEVQESIELGWTVPGGIEPAPLPPSDDDLGTRTLMGIGARAVRATARSGWVEARPATREPEVTAEAQPSHAVMPHRLEAPPMTAPRIEVEPPPVVQPLHLRPARAPVIPAIVPEVTPAFAEVTWQVRPLALGRRASGGRRSRAGLRAFVIFAIAAVAAVAGYLASAMLFAVSKT